MGDRNFKFFHIYTIERRFRNMIMSLKDKNDRWIKGDDKIKNLSNRFFLNLLEYSSPYEDQI